MRAVAPPPSPQRPVGPPLLELAQRVRPQALAVEEHLPLTGELADALGVPGLRRGTLITCGGAESGRTSLALALLAAATAAGEWAAVVGIPDLGIVAASELGVALDRLVLVPDPGRRAGSVLGALVDGFELVVLGSSLVLAPREQVALLARVRQRRVVLIGLERPRAARSWPELPDLALEVVGTSFVGLEHGSGRIAGRRLEVVARPRRGGQQRHAALWLPPPPGDPAMARPAAPAFASRRDPVALALP